MMSFPAFTLLFVQSLLNTIGKMASVRLVTFTEADMKSFSEEEEYVNTKKRPSYDLKSFKEFFGSVDERRELQEIPAAELSSSR